MLMLMRFRGEVGVVFAASPAPLCTRQRCCVLLPLGPFDALMASSAPRPRRPVSFSYAQKLVLKRDDLARLANHKQVADYARGLLVRIRANPTQYRLFTVDGRAPDATGPYKPSDAGTSAAQPFPVGWRLNTTCTTAADDTRLKLFGKYKNRKQPFRVSLVSNSPATQEEYDRYVADNTAAGQQVPTLVEAARILQRSKSTLAEVG